MGQSTVPTTGGTPRGSSQGCLHHCLSQPSLQRLLRVWELGGPYTPRPYRPRGRGHLPTLQAGGQQRKGGFSAAFWSLCLVPHLQLGWRIWKAKQGPFLPHGAWRPLPALLQLGNQTLGKVSAPLGCSWGPQEGSQATEQPLRSCLHHPPPCSGPHQRRTLRSWSRRHKTGKYSDQREGITVQKKRVQPERAPAHPEPRAPWPRRPRPCPARWKRYRSRRSLAWGAVSQGMCLTEPHIWLSLRGNQLQAQGRWHATVPDSKRLPHRTGRQQRGPPCQQF